MKIIENMALAEIQYCYSLEYFMLERYLLFIPFCKYIYIIFIFTKYL